MDQDPLSLRERDLVTLFNVIWYRDFPYTQDRIDEKRVRAMYTAHINGIVKACADLMGFFTMFEHGQRTDAIIKNANANDRSIAKIEIEWSQPFREKVNEIGKLSKAANDQEAETYIFIGYSDVAQNDRNIKAITDQWLAKGRHLIAILIEYKLSKDRRHLREMKTYAVKDGAAMLVRSQPALPWEVPATRWHLVIDPKSVEN